MQMRKITAEDAPLFLRAGISRSDVKVLENNKDYEAFKTTSGVAFNGYGFAADEEVIIPDLPILDNAGKEHQKLISIPAYEDAPEDRRVYLLEVTRRKNGVEFKSWLNLRQLSNRSFVDQKYPDEFREKMATEFSNDYDRLEFLRGGVITTVGTTEMKRYAFDKDRAIKVDENGERVLDKPLTVSTVEFTPKSTSTKK